MKYLLGVIAGIVGIILMFFSLHLQNKLILDLRNIPIIVVAANGGVASSLPAAIIVTVGRAMLFGASTVSFQAAANVLVIGVVAPMLAAYITNRKYRSLILNLYSQAQTSMFLGEIPFHLLVFYWILVIGMGFLVEYVLSTLIHYFNLQVKLKKSSELDFLTRLNNVQKFESELKYIAEMSREKQVPFSLLMIDVDKFKNVNDTYGHSVGDKVLKELALLFQQNCRPQDIVSRKGGEEFVIILPECSEPVAADIAERIRNAVERHEFADVEGLRVTISLGHTTNTGELSPDHCVDLADKALYEAKYNRRNRVYIA